MDTLQLYVSVVNSEKCEFYNKVSKVFDFFRRYYLGLMCGFKTNNIMNDKISFE